MRPSRFSPQPSSDLRINHQIRIREVRLIGDDGSQIGVVPTPEALKIAQEKGLDLVEVAPDAWPPVCKILDYGKYKYEQSKRSRKARKRQHAVQLKEVRIRPKTGANDLQIKADRARRFLDEGARVQVNVFFRGREMARQDLGRKVLQRFVGMLADVAKVENSGRMEGRRLIAMLVRKPGAPYAAPKSKKAASPPPAEAAERNVPPATSAPKPREEPAPSVATAAAAAPETEAPGPAAPGDGKAAPREAKEAKEEKAKEPETRESEDATTAAGDASVEPPSPGEPPNPVKPAAPPPSRSGS